MIIILGVKKLESILPWKDLNNGCQLRVLDKREDSSTLLRLK